MLNNTWFPKEVDMTRDANDYKQLTDGEKTAYDAPQGGATASLEDHLGVDFIW